MTGAPIDRPGARVVVLDGEDRVLLFRCVDGGRTFWTLPGGAVEPGETDADAAARELAEETGLTGVPLQPLEWTRGPVLWTWVALGKTFASRERFFLARVPRAFAVEPPEGLERDVIVESRWWSADELVRARTDGVVVWPSRLAEHLRALLEHGPPAEPVDLGE